MDDTTPKGVFKVTADSVEVASSPNSHHTLASEIAALFTHFIRRPQPGPQPVEVVHVAEEPQPIPASAVAAAQAAAAEIAAAKTGK